MHFCEGCPAYCCYKKDGAYLLIFARDINRLARFFGITDANVRRKYMADRHSLRVRENGSCIFFIHGNTLKRCTVYPARPDQCRSFPHGEACPYLTDTTKLTASSDGLK